MAGAALTWITKAKKELKALQRIAPKWFENVKIVNGKPVHSWTRPPEGKAPSKQYAAPHAPAKKGTGAAPKPGQAGYKEHLKTIQKASRRNDARFNRRPKR